MIEGIDLTRAWAGVTLTSYLEPGDSMHEALLNPATLPIRLNVEMGELNPVGGSHSVLQYGHTKSPSIPLEFYFSTQYQGRGKQAGQPGRTVITPIEVSQYVNWLLSFCYGAQPGEAPSPLLIIWPQTLNIAIVVKSVEASYVRFAADLTPMAAKVNVEFTELRYSFKGSTEQAVMGFKQRDPFLSTGKTGPPLNMRNWNKD